jgi:hypothetical protein
MLFERHFDFHIIIEESEDTVWGGRFCITCSGKEWGRHEHLHGVFLFREYIVLYKSCISGGVDFALYP